MKSWQSAAPEAVLLREALLGLGYDRPEFRAAAERLERWDPLLELARAYAVSGAVWGALELRGLGELVPAAVREELQEDHAGETARNALILVEAAEIQATLLAEGIESVLLKGPALLAAHYPSLGARHVGDIDLLVRITEVERAAEVMRGVGAKAWGLAMGHQDGRHGRADGVEHLAPVLTTRGVLLELHHHVPGGEATGADVEGTIACSRLVPWQGQALRIPSALDLAAIACTHVFSHHQGEAKYLPRQLADLSVLMGSGATTWAAVEARQGHGTSAAAVRGSRSLLEHADRPVPWTLRATPWTRITRTGQLLAARARISPAAALRVLFPVRGYMAARYGVSEASWWFPLLYLWRPVRGAVRVLLGR